MNGLFFVDNESQQTITTVSTIWFSIRVYGQLFDNFSPMYGSIAQNTKSSLDYNALPNSFNVLLLEHWKCFHIMFFQQRQKKETQMLKFIHIHLYMHFIVIGNVSCMCVFFALFLTFFFSWMLCCYNSHSGTYSHLHFCSHSFNRSGDNERKWQESTESYAFSS